MIFVLDTDILSLLAHRDSPEAPRIRRRIAQFPPDDSVVTTIINYEEQMRGWMALIGRSKSSRNEVAIYGRLLEHLNTFRRIRVLGYDETSAAIASDLRGQRLRLGAMDLKIAAITLSNGATLVSRNLADFRVVPNLPIEDWSTE
jgi:tRNA(fMet)-specific endonuclease VapC